MVKLNRRPLYQVTCNLSVTSANQCICWKSWLWRFLLVKSCDQIVGQLCLAIHFPSYLCPIFAASDGQCLLSVLTGTLWVSLSGYLHSSLSTDTHLGSGKVCSTRSYILCVIRWFLLFFGFPVKPVVKRTLSILQCLAKSVEGEQTRCKVLLHQALMEAIETALSLFPVYLNHPGMCLLEVMRGIGNFYSGGSDWNAQSGETCPVDHVPTWFFVYQETHRLRSNFCWLAHLLINWSFCSDFTVPMPESAKLQLP